MKARFALPAAAALALVLAGCGEVTTAHRLVKDPIDYFLGAAVDRDFRTVVVGNPVAAPDAAVAALVVDALNRNYRKFRANFTLQPGASERKPYKAVIVFNPAKNLDMDDACDAPEKVETGSGDGKLTVVGVFCGDFPLSMASATVAAPASIDDAPLKRAIELVAWKLVPEFRPIIYNTN